MSDQVSYKHIAMVDRKVTILAPTQAKVRAYHVGGKSAAQLYRETRKAFKEARL